MSKPKLTTIFGLVKDIHVLIVISLHHPIRIVCSIDASASLNIRIERVVQVQRKGCVIGPIGMIDFPVISCLWRVFIWTIGALGKELFTAVNVYVNFLVAYIDNEIV